MKKHFLNRTAAGILCLGLLMQTSAYLPATAADKTSVTVNEICTKNTEYAASDGNFYDWIELYNSGKESADISGWGLSDKEKEPYRYVFPQGTSIPAEGRLVVFCDSDAALNNNSIAPFGLSASGETIVLTDKEGNTAHTVEAGALAANTSYGQYPDGSGEFYTLDCTPDKANCAPEGQAAVHLPVFSSDSGFYDSSFSLTLTADEGCTVYYTTDGSDPTPESTLYEEPITVKDMSDTENRLSARTDITPNRAEAPNSEVDKAAVIRAVAVDSEGRVSEAVTKTYFIGKTNSGYYPEMKVVSLVTDPDNLFDNEKGIYCLGKEYETSKQKGGNAWEIPANYNMKGKEWERPASFTLFDNGEKVVEQTVGIRIKGNYSRCLAQKSFNIYTRQDYGTPEFDYDFFSGTATKAKNGKAIKKYEGIVLRNGGNDNSTAFFRDSINQKLITDRSFGYQASTECVLFIDGEYWGTYQLLEKIDRSYVSSHYGVKKSDVAMIKNGELDDGSEQDLQDWSQLVKDISDKKLSYEEICSKIDMQSFIDYFAAQIYWANGDWPKRNYIFWRSDAIDEENPYADGKWRPILFDTESGQGLYGSSDKSFSADSFSRLRSSSDELSKMFTSLQSFDDFRMEFSRTMMDMANNNFTTEKTQSVINYYKNNFKEQMADTFARFYSRSMSGDTSKRWESAYSTILDFYAKRYNYAERTTRSAMKLSAAPQKLRVINKASNGSIGINTLDLGTISDWSGYYHSDYDINVSAAPEEGKTFSHWIVRGCTITEGDANSPGISIKLESNATVIAVYDTDTDEEFEEYMEAVQGDVNGDGSFNVADLIILQKWLSGYDDAELASWKAADMCQDGVIDVFDLTSMRKALLSQMDQQEQPAEEKKEEPKPEDNPEDKPADGPQRPEEGHQPGGPKHW